MRIRAHPAGVAFLAMQSAFPTVLWVVCGLAIVMALIALAHNAKTWEEFGRRRLWMEREFADGATRLSSPAALAERDEEIRQMLEARNARRRRRGEPPLDIEAELARLVAPQVDAGLRVEIRQLVVARNVRRARRGQAPLDVETEVERQIAELHLEG